MTGFAICLRTRSYPASKKGFFVTFCRKTQTDVNISKNVIGGL